MTTPKLLCFVGMPGAGKSSCVDYLKEKGFPSVYFGGITLKEVKNRGLDVTPENEKLVREDLRRLHGTDAYAKLIAEEIDHLAEAGQHDIVVDGLYSWSEYKFFKKKYGHNAIIIAIVAPRELRHKRLEKRAVRPLTPEEASARDYAEIENLEKGGPIGNADYTILNDRDLPYVIERLDELLQKNNSRK
jgi:dephospho-CoA kinase